MHQAVAADWGEKIWRQFQDVLAARPGAGEEAQQEDGEPGW